MKKYFTIKSIINATIPIEVKSRWNILLFTKEILQARAKIVHYAPKV